MISNIEIIVLSRKKPRSRRFEPGALAWKTAMVAPRLEIYTSGFEGMEEVAAVSNKLFRPRSKEL